MERKREKKGNLDYVTKRGRCIRTRPGRKFKHTVTNGKGDMGKIEQEGRKIKINRKWKSKLGKIIQNEED